VVRDGPPPIGVVTERDLVRKLLAAGRDPATLRVSDVMTAPVRTVTREATALEAFQLLRACAFRRLPVVDQHGGLVGIVTQSDLLRAMIADMEEANRLKTDILAVISHELRTPIAVVAGYVELLIDGTFEPLIPQQQEVVANIQRASSQLVDLVNTAFELTQLEAGRVSVTRRLINVGMLLEELGDEFEARVPEGVSLHWHNEVGTEPVLGDHAKIKTSLKSLVDNALKFTSAGSVTVTAAWTEGLLTFVVQDTGIGIPAAELSTIFDMFRQGDSSGTRRFEGFGLGLHVVKRLVDLLGGTITVDSTPGVGSTFRMTVPAPRSAGGQPARL
jgi:signal transduction histidine kinase